MKTKKILYLSLIILCVISGIIVGWYLLSQNVEASLNSQIDHLDIAKKISANSISDVDLSNIFDNHVGVSTMDKNLTVFLAGYLNMQQLGLSEDQFYSSIDEAKGLKLREKIFLKNILKNKYIPIIKSENKNLKQ